MKKISVFLLIMISLSSCMTKEERYVNKIIAEMTTRQKIAQLMMVSIDSYQTPEMRAERDSMVIKEGIGGFIVMDDQLLRSMARISELQSISRIPLAVGIDGEWGPSMRFAEMPFFPKAIQLGALPNDSLVYEMGLAVGKQCKDLGIQINFAPVVDININPRNPVINSRSFGSDRDKVALYGSAYMRGMQDAGIYACAKHFPGHGDTEVDSHTDLPTLTFSRERLDTMELVPFKKLINDGVKMVMLGHLNIPSLDTITSSISYKVVTELLKNELGFKGIVVSDGLGMKGVAKDKTAAEVAYLVYKAGIDLLLMPRDPIGGIDLIETAIKNGELSEEDLNNRVRKILLMKYYSGLFKELPKIPTNDEDLMTICNRPADVALIGNIARQTITEVGSNKVQVTGDKNMIYIGYGAEYKQLVREYGEHSGLSGYSDRSGVLEGNMTSALIAFYNAGCDVEYIALGTNGIVTDKELATALKTAEKYKEVVIGFHNVITRGHNILNIPQTHINMIEEFASNKTTNILYFGNPYGLQDWNNTKIFNRFLVGYADTPANEEAAAEIMIGRGRAEGAIPVQW